MSRDTPSQTLEIKGLEKSFGRNRVLRGIDLSLQAGEVVALMGANGAGKSTLVKVICGHHTASAGTIELDGCAFTPSTAAEAISKGVVTVHQSIDDGVIPDLDVATNLTLDRLTMPGAALFIRSKAMRNAARTIADEMGLDIDVRARVADLSVADRQMIAIARAMARTPKVLILDEPTSSLSATEANRLFHLIDKLRDQGVAILYISHRMSDIRRIADRIVSMRDGAVAGMFEGENLDYEGAVMAMLGHKMTDVDFPIAAGETPILTLHDMQLHADSPPINLTAYDGEVIAVIGLLGSGKSLLAEVIFGLSQPHAGQMSLDAKPYAANSPQKAMNAGIFMSSKDRATNAVIPAFDIANNMTLPFLGAFTHGSLLSGRRQRRKANDMINQIGVMCQSNADSINTLSGGNQQKVMIARWLLEPCRVLLLDEPFQGVDIGARRDIGTHIRATAKGRATLVFCAEIDEALEIADRIVVLNEGALVGEHVNENIDLAALVAQVSAEQAHV